MNDFVSKPVDFPHLLRVIAAHTDGDDMPASLPADNSPDPLFDKARLESCARLMGEEGIAEVRQRFDTLIADFNAVLAKSGEPTEQAALAHSVAGCASYLGLQRLTVTCRAFEQAIRAEDFETARRMADGMRPLIAASCRHLP